MGLATRRIEMFTKTGSCQFSAAPTRVMSICYLCLACLLHWCQVKELLLYLFIFLFISACMQAVSYYWKLFSLHPSGAGCTESPSVHEIAC